MNDDQIGQRLIGLSNAITSTTEAPVLLRQAITRRARRGRVIVGTATVAACLVTAIGAAWAARPDPAPRNPASAVAAPSAGASEDPVTSNGGLERFSTSTAGDWVSVADRVIVGTVKSEQEQPPTRTEIRRGEGYTGRTVTITIDETVWSRGNVPSIPGEITLPVAGSSFSGGVGKNRNPIVFQGTSRLEVGHRYVLALYYPPPACVEKKTPARWTGIGSGGIIPYDTDTLGTGEFEGRSNVVVPDAASGEGILRAQLRGKPLADLRSALDAAKGRPRPSETSFC